ncbi:hypothetical protein [Tenacibaculum aestuariivivum]|uniref:hypothetical protein n=1 Tax=Tenacibaculum aestuariivivum TaxID=2006131 RepID=UPI003AB39639
MTFKLTTYKTLKGIRKILELKEKKNTEAIIYKDDIPSFYVDCFDLKTESNVIMNSLVLCKQQSMSNVIKEIGRKNNVNLHIPVAPLLSYEKSAEYTELELPPLPESWLN